MDTFLRNQRSLVEHSTLKSRPNSIEIELGDEDDYDADEPKVNHLEMNTNLKSIKALRNEVKLLANLQEAGLALHQSILQD